MILGIWKALGELNWWNSLYSKCIIWSFMVFKGSLYYPCPSQDGGVDMGVGDRLVIQILAVYTYGFLHCAFSAQSSYVGLGFDILEFLFSLCVSSSKPLSPSLRSTLDRSNSDVGTICISHFTLRHPICTR